MKSMRILPLLAVLALHGCDRTDGWLRGHSAATAYAAPLASDTTVVTTRRVWSWSGQPDNSRVSLFPGAIMPDGSGVAATEWNTGDLAIFDLASRAFRQLTFNEPDAASYAYTSVASPDGGRVAFQWNARGPDGWETDLRVVDIATGESRIVMTVDTTVASSVDPGAWTPAGDSIFAFLWHRDPGGAAKILLIPAAGGTPRLVHTIPQLLWSTRMSLSPDGRWLLYDHELSRNQHTRSDVYIIDVKSGGARPLVEHSGLDALVGWLPDTDVVLFSSDRSGTTDLWSVRVTNGRASAEPRLVRSGFFRSQAIGFGDGALFYRVDSGSRGQAIINVDPQSGVLLGPASPLLAQLNTFPRALAWSLDGHALAAPTSERGSWNITVHSLETGDSRVFWHDDGVRASAVAWAADGQSLFLRAVETAAPLTSPRQFLRLDLATGTTTQLFAAEAPAEPDSPEQSIRSFLVTPDGRSIVLRQRRVLSDGRAEMKLVLRSLVDGSDRELHRTHGFIPEFSLSADGTQLAFVQQIWEDVDSLFVMRMDGSQPVRTVTSWAYDAISLLGWLPAGHAMLAARLTEDGTAEEILRIEFDGSTTVVGTSPFRPERGQRVQGAYRSRLVLSPAGNRLAHVVSERGEEVWRMDGLHELFSNAAPTAAVSARSRQRPGATPAAGAGFP